MELLSVYRRLRLHPLSLLSKRLRRPRMRWRRMLTPPMECWLEPSGAASSSPPLCLVLMGGALVLLMLTGLVSTDKKSLSLLFLRDPCLESHPSPSPRKLRLSLFCC